jgi:hypothetical protein
MNQLTIIENPKSDPTKNNRATVSFACNICAVIECNQFELVSPDSTELRELDNCKIYYGPGRNNENYLLDRMDYIANYLLGMSAKGPISVRYEKGVIIAEFEPKSTSPNEIYEDFCVNRDFLADGEYTNPESKFVITMAGMIYSRIDIIEESVNVNIDDHDDNPILEINDVHDDNTILAIEGATSGIIHTGYSYYE